MKTKQVIVRFFTFLLGKYYDFEDWFNDRFSWFFTNGMKDVENPTL